MAKTITLYDKNFIDTALNEKADNSEVDGIIDDPSTAVIDDFVLDNGEYKATLNFPLSKVPDTAVLYALCGGKGGQFALKYNYNNVGNAFKVAYVECSDPSVANFTKDGVNYLTSSIEFKPNGQVVFTPNAAAGGMYWGVGLWKNVTIDNIKYWTLISHIAVLDGTLPRIYGGGDYPLTDLVYGYPQENHTLGFVKQETDMGQGLSAYNIFARVDEYDENTDTNVIDNYFQQQILVVAGGSTTQLASSFAFLDGEKTLSLVPQNGEVLDYARLACESMAVSERINQNKMDIAATQTSITTQITSHNYGRTAHTKTRNLVQTPTGGVSNFAMLTADDDADNGVGWKTGLYGIMAATLAVNENYYYFEGHDGSFMDNPIYNIHGLLIVRGTVDTHPQDKSKFLYDDDYTQDLVKEDGTANDAEINPTADCMTIILIQPKANGIGTEARILFKFGYPSA